MIKTGAPSKQGRGDASFWGAEGRNVAWRVREDLVPYNMFVTLAVIHFTDGVELWPHCRSISRVFGQSSFSGIWEAAFCFCKLAQELLKNQWWEKYSPITPNLFGNLQIYKVLMLSFHMSKKRCSISTEANGLKLIHDPSEVLHRQSPTSPARLYSSNIII